MSTLPIRQDLPDPPQPEGAGRAAAPVGPAAELDLVEALVVLGRAKRVLFGVPFAAAVVAAGISLVLPKTYTATAKILPPQQAQSAAAAMLGQLGGLAGAAGGALGLKSPAELYIGMLKSTTVADALIARFKLKELYDQELMEETRKALALRSRFGTDKSGLISIEADAGDPALAADLANAYVEELHRLTSRFLVTDASQRRAFFESQLQQTNDRLADAEVKLRLAMRSGGLVSVDAQGRAAVETSARLGAQISVKEIQLGAMRAYASAGNPDLRRAEQELASMQKELARLESGGSGTPVLKAEERAGEGGSAASGVTNVRLLREVKYHEVMFELLARQYELARLEESKEAPVIQVLDRASPPERRSRPRRTLIVLLTGFFAALGTAIAILLRHSLEGARGDPAMQQRLGALGAAWWSRKP